MHSIVNIVQKEIEDAQLLLEEAVEDLHRLPCYEFTDWYGFCRGYVEALEAVKKILIEDEQIENELLGKE